METRFSTEFIPSVFTDFELMSAVFYFYFTTEKYFDMKKTQCKEGLDIYKKFLTRMTRISEFLKVAEVISSLPALSLMLFIHSLPFIEGNILRYIYIFVRKL